MAKITITAFSCIKHAEMEITDINVIIGPQGSGKSVTTKLIYFFTEILSDFIRAAEDDFSVKDYKKQLEKRFAVWFPSSAWGEGRFHITFTSDEFFIRVLRRKIAGKQSEEVVVSTSKWFDTIYAFAEKSYLETSRSPTLLDGRDEFSATNSLENSWRIRSRIQRKISTDLGNNYISQQTFIPAGRAFFTSIGRLVAGIEHAGSLDPVTLKFAKLFASWRDRSNSFIYHDNATSSFGERRDRMMEELFNGRVSAKRESEFIEMLDGRKVPFSSLSSGQQELIPIWFFLENLLLMDFLDEQRKTKANARDRQLVYIEEPEAHLFPSAQSALMNVLIGSVLSEKSRRILVLTTHSPYIMTKLNVFLKAGQLSRRKKRNQDIHAIVDRSCWIGREQLSAWSIEDGEVKSIIDEDEGLIDAQYLDAISDVMSNEFSKLLDIEAEI